MPLNPLIPLAVEPPQIPNPVDQMGKMLSMQNEQTVLANNRLSLQQNQKEVADRQKIEQIFSEEPNVDKAIARVSKEVDPLTAQGMAAAYQKQVQEQKDWLTKNDTENLDNIGKKHGIIRDQLGAVLAQPEDDPDSLVESYKQAWDTFNAAKIPTLNDRGTPILPVPAEFERFAKSQPLLDANGQPTGKYDTSQARAVLTDLYRHSSTTAQLAADEQAKRAAEDDKSKASESTAKAQSAWLDVIERQGRGVTDQASLDTFRKQMGTQAPASVFAQIPTKYDPQTWQKYMQTTAPGKATGDDFARLVASKEQEIGRPLTSAEEIALHKEFQTTPLSGMNALYNDVDPKSLADGIKKGLNPPDISQYGRPVAAAVASELSKTGYDLSKAQLEWAAAKRFMSTANGAQQQRLRQGIDNAYHSLDVIDAAAAAWGGGRFPALNSAMLTGSTAGVVPGTTHATIPLFDRATGKITPTTKDWTASEIARVLQGQIADLTSELGNVYMGGNSPTDTALGLAAHNLAGQWSERDLHTMVDLARTNLAYRNNAIANVGAVGVGGGPNMYAPQGGAGGGPGPQGAPSLPYGTRTLPNGTIISAPVVR